MAVGSVELHYALKSGDDEAAIHAAAALGLDALAAAIPFVPGGASIALKAAKAAEKLKDGKKLTADEAQALATFNDASKKTKNPKPDPKEFDVDGGIPNNYEKNPKHGKNHRGSSSPEPSNPEKSLNNSVPLNGNTSRRIGYDKETGEFSVFDETHPGKSVFHGHSRKWSELSQEMKNVLIRNGIVNNKGKYLK